ncbi:MULTISPECIES: SusC/RagA family TonB-linked outer membrane protein [Flavobacteriaceae]|uniref:SusC/RagA family TonB-linked outer membrane protein n=1 Tax=Flavobacteriaceae TaxID=49546 RepID=UPI001491A004|nr:MULTISPECIES: SusC/RagA family TonB-linked outer membrane protein [Allomuricauda]MDC6366816.1 SusC/RagA family TonB-linked outer membrane protein [Muricauda sp. AC10]
MKNYLFILFFSLCFAFSHAQERTVSGTVTADGLPLSGVNVIVVGRSAGTMTDFDGNYEIKVSGDDTSLEFSYLGFETQVVTIGDRSQIDVEMIESSTKLDEVVVTALGIEREKKALGYSAQEISGESLVEAREVSVANSLKGKVAGVFVASGSGGVGGSTFVQIRGSSSLSGNNQPLYVIDGIPMSNDNLNQTNIFAGRDFGDGIKDLNADDIESISVLKGPNAAALYGTRGANGVILITTKKSKKNQSLGITYNSNATLETINVIPKFQNSYGSGYGDTFGFATTTYEGVEYPVQGGGVDNWGGKFDDRLIIINSMRDLGPVPYSAQPADNVRDFYQTGSTFTNSLAVDGGTEKVNYRVSASLLKSNGVIPNMTFDRQTFTAVLGANVTDKLRIETKANYIQTGANNRPIVGVSSGRNVAAALNLVPRNIDLDWLAQNGGRNEDGSYRNWRNGSPTNPYWLINEVTSEDSRNRFIGYLSANYKLAPWLNIMGRVGSDSYVETQRQQYSQGTPGSAYINGRLDFNTYKVNELNVDGLLTASGSLSEAFTGSLSLGASQYKRRWEKSATVARNMNIPDLYTVENADLVIPTYDLVRREIQSVYATGQLGYKNHTFLDLSVRNDWSSTLGEGNYSFMYPSASISHVLSDAYHFNPDVFSFVKLRASYAQAGNDAAPYQTKGGYTVNPNEFNGNRFAQINGSVPATDLKNELTTSFEVGADLRLFKNRVGIDFTYYNSRTENQILSIGLSGSTGFDGLYLNAGEVSNKGIEVLLSLTPIQIKDSFKWVADINFSKNKSNIESLVDGIDRYNFISVGVASIIAEPGSPYGSILGYKYKRSPDGDLVVNAAGTRYVREDDLSILGNIQPDWLAGITNTFSYKGLSLSALLDIRMGGELFSWSRYDQNGKGTGVWTNNRENLTIEGVIDNGDGTYTPSVQENVLGQDYWAGRTWGSITEEFIMDASYVTLREINLGYTFGSAILDRTPFDSAKISLVGRNIAYLYRDSRLEEMGIAPGTAFSPTAAAQGYESFSMPTTRSLGMNLTLKF